MQHLKSNSSVNIAMQKIKSSNLTAGILSQNYTYTIKSLIAKDEAFNLMNTLKGTPAYWKRFQLEVLAMIKQLGLPTFFITLSCADLRWHELIEIIYKLNEGDILANDDIHSMNYFDNTKILNSNPVLLARHFQYRVEVFFKEIVSDVPLGKNKHYAIRVEFQVKGTPHMHSLVCVTGAPILSTISEDEYVAFIDNIIKRELPNRQERSRLFELVRNYQTHSHSKSCRKYKSIECRYSCGKYFTDHTIIAHPVSDKLSVEEKALIMQQRKLVLSTVKKYIGTHLNPKTNNLYSPTENFYQADKPINAILQELQISEDQNYKALSISSDITFQIHFKRDPESCFIDKHFEDGLIAWEANLDIQLVLDYYKAVSYMCAYLSKQKMNNPKL